MNATGFWNLDAWCAGRSTIAHGCQPMKEPLVGSDDVMIRAPARPDNNVLSAKSATQLAGATRSEMIRRSCASAADGGHAAQRATDHQVESNIPGRRTGGISRTVGRQ